MFLPRSSFGRAWLDAEGGGLGNHLPGRLLGLSEGEHALAIIRVALVVLQLCWQLPGGLNLLSLFFRHL